MSHQQEGGHLALPPAFCWLNDFRSPPLPVSGHSRAESTGMHSGLGAETEGEHQGGGGGGETEEDDGEAEKEKSKQGCC